jgi:hypothetical protein
MPSPCFFVREDRKTAAPSDKLCFLEETRMSHLVVKLCTHLGVAADVEIGVGRFSQEGLRISSASLPGS